MYVPIPVQHPPRRTENRFPNVRVAQLIAFVVGYVLQDIKLAVYIALGGTALTFLVVVPAWPFFKKNPVRWLPVRGAPAISVPQNLVIDEKAIR